MTLAEPQAPATLPLPPLPDLTTLTHTTHPVLDQVLTDLASRPANRVAYYDDSPYITVDPEPDEDDDGPWCAAPRP